MWKLSCERHECSKVWKQINHVLCFAFCEGKKDANMLTMVYKALTISFFPFFFILQWRTFWCSFLYFHSLSPWNIYFPFLREEYKCFLFCFFNPLCGLIWWQWLATGWQKKNTKNCLGALWGACPLQNKDRTDPSFMMAVSLSKSGWSALCSASLCDSVEWSALMGVLSLEEIVMLPRKVPPRARKHDKLPFK